MKSILGPAVAALLFSSCAMFAPSPGVLERQIGSWDGKTQEQLIHAWGKPSRTMDDGSGGHVLIYSSSIQESGGWGGGGTNEFNYLPVEIPLNGFSPGGPVSAS